MKWPTYILFYGYVLLLIAAGAWGAFFGAKLDHQLLFGLDVETLDPKTAASLVSQYRFLRAIELGFGMASLLFRKEIFSDIRFNRIFLAIMLSGVIARIVSLILEGYPNSIFYFFLVSEILGVIFIFIYSRTTLGKPS